MAAYRRMDGLVTCGLTACTPHPMLSNEYEKRSALWEYVAQGGIHKCISSCVINFEWVFDKVTEDVLFPVFIDLKFTWN